VPPQALPEKLKVIQSTHNPNKENYFTRSPDQIRYATQNKTPQNQHHNQLYLQKAAEYNRLANLDNPSQFSSF
jgi:hypothetical protein